MKYLAALLASSPTEIPADIYSALPPKPPKPSPAIENPGTHAPEGAPETSETSPRADSEDDPAAVARGRARIAVKADDRHWPACWLVDELDFVGYPVPMARVLEAAEIAGLSEDDVHRARRHVPKLPPPFDGWEIGVMHARPASGEPHVPFWYAYRPEGAP